MVTRSQGSASSDMEKSVARSLNKYAAGGGFEFRAFAVPMFTVFTAVARAG